MKHVLVVEDDKEIVNLLEIHLLDLDCRVTKAYDGAEGFRLAIEESPDLIILDIALPKMDGMEICRRVRKQKNTPIIMLTAKTEEIDRVLGLELGADDYMTKPFSVREFSARVKAIFRRTSMIEESMQSEDQKSHLDRNGVTIDIEKRKVIMNNERIDLSPKEFELLVLMASHPGRCYSRSDLLRLIWGYDFDGYEHTVNSHINRLRAKIEPDMNSPKFIMTEWGVGYKFNEDL